MIAETPQSGAAQRSARPGAGQADKRGVAQG